MIFPMLTFVRMLHTIFVFLLQKGPKKVKTERPSRAPFWPPKWPPKLYFSGLNSITKKNMKKRYPVCLKYTKTHTILLPGGDGKVGEIIGYRDPFLVLVGVVFGILAKRAQDGARMAQEGVKMG